MSAQESNMREDQSDHLIKVTNLEKVLDMMLQQGRQTMKHYLDLGRAYHSSYSETHQQQDLESAIAFCKDGLNHCPSDRDCQVELLLILGKALMDHYKIFRRLSCLEEAVACHTQVLDLCPLGDPGRSTYLNDHALTVWTRFEELGDLGDLKKAIVSCDQALELCPLGHPLRRLSLNNLVNALQSRYNQLGEMKDLEKTITCHEGVLELCPPGHPHRPLYLNKLASALQTRYKQLGEIEDLQKAITCYEQAMELCLPGHPHRPLSLNNLANALQSRYNQLGQIEDLERTITCHEGALELHPPGHSNRSLSLNNLASALQSRYNRFGEIEDLEKVITWNEEALELRPPGHPLRSSSLNNLANAFWSRYKQLHEIEDMEKAITWIEQALELRPPGHPHRPSSLHILANALWSKYDQLGGIEDLEKAIICYKEALELYPPGYPDRSLSLNNLANALQRRYNQLGRIEDLEKAITWVEEAVELCPPGHPLRSSSLTYLANAFWGRYVQLGKIKDLEEVITCHEEALRLRPPGHPDRSSSLNNLGTASWARYQQLGNQEDLEKAIVCYNQAASSTSRLLDRLTGAKYWASLSHIHGLGPAISAYSLALDLLQQHLALLSSITSQQKLVEKHFYLSLNAAACAISMGTPEMAVQLLEQGRSILWSRIQGYRQSLEDISQQAPQLAQEFQFVSKQLAHNATSGGADLTLQRVLSERWTALLRDIRKLDGFSDYLQATPFSIVQTVSSEGPVIMVNISDFRSDAIILVPHAPPAVVPLHNVSPQTLKELVNQLSSATATSNPFKTGKVLQQLWKNVVNPVVDKLAQLGVSEKSRIWWCPTSYLCALPLHAAGPYTKGFKNLPDLYISSYTPTLASLIRARSSIPKSQSIPSLLLVSQPDDTIPHVFEEAKIINSLETQITSCSGHAADKQGVVEALQSHPWVHFACHGHLEAQPFNSWFQLHNGEHLTVLDLTKAQLPNAEFVFLSACHSAAGGVQSTLDESIHLAGALQFSGFRSVIGTLWAMVDDVGPSMANEFYKYMFHNPGSVNLRDAAEALNIATKALRRQGVSVDQWINFIHIGA